MDPTILIALITAIAAIIAPVITSIINSNNEIKLKEIEIEENRFNSVLLHEREVLENALSGVGILMSWKDSESVKEASRNILKAVAYVDSNTGFLLRKAVNSVINNEDEISSWDYNVICEAIQKEIAQRTESAFQKKNK